MNSPALSIRPLRADDIPTARAICNHAFATFLGLPDPGPFAGGRDFVTPRWQANPVAAFAAELDGRLVGSNFVTRWGSVGFFGPLTVAPEFWNRRVAQALLGPTMELLRSWDLAHIGLYTFAHSPKHLALYRKFGFFPRFLNSIMLKELSQAPAAHCKTYAALNPDQRTDALTACRELTNRIYPGLDLTSEIQSIYTQQLGDTVLLWDSDSLDAFAVCHCGEGTEGGTGNCYVKFAAARPGSGAQKTFSALLDAVESFALERNLQRIEAGMSLARRNAFDTMLAHGFRMQNVGVNLHNPDEPAYHRPDAFVIDDWR